jgi:hypothetical protein
LYGRGPRPIWPATWPIVIKNLASDPTYYSPSNQKTNPLPILARAHSPFIHVEVKQKENTLMQYLPFYQAKVRWDFSTKRSGMDYVRDSEVGREHYPALGCWS